MDADKKELQPHQQRVVDEQIELNGKIDKLTVFLDKDNLRDMIDVAEEQRLEFQLSTMRTYSLILGARINSF